MVASTCPSTTTAWTPALFSPVTDRLTGSSVMTQVTYPRFISTPSGKLLFTYRYGGSGGGDEILYEYDGTSHAWSLVGQYTTRSGSYTGTFSSGTDRNGYFDNTLFDANGRLQPPENEVLAAFLARRWNVPIATTRMIAAGAAGNVRAAMADLEMWMG
jgi:hypothetical protein